MTSPTLELALEVLLDDALAHVVDLVLLSRDGLVEAHSHGGSVWFERNGRVHAVRGRNPLERQDPGAFSPLADEVARARPSNAQNHYPFAYENIGQLFEDPRAPDIAVVHTPAHNWEERGGHPGEHGSLDVVQARAPLVLAGTGIKARGGIDAAARIVDVGPTLVTLAGVDRADGTVLRAQDGRVLADVLDPAERPRRVVAILCDGTNANVLYAMAEAGECPNVARLMQAGVFYRHGCIATFPSVTLANHTSGVTGVQPSRHGILSNFFYDRASGRQIVANSPETWHLARFEIRPDVETIFEAVSSEGGFAAAINEPADRGATYSTFDFLRSGEVSLTDAPLPPASDDPDATQAFVADKRDYQWASSADGLAVRQFRELWSGVQGNDVPRLTWVNLILPDAGNHAGGPYSDIGWSAVRDTDRRIGRILDEIRFEDGGTAVVVLADHGMEESDPDCKGDFDEALVQAGIPFRDEGYGFLYLDV